jgi:flagellar M-ring protein FliF
VSERIVEQAPRRQWLVLGSIFAVMVGLLVVGYLLFLRPNYVVLVQGLRPGETAPIVAELDKSGTPYRVTDGGGTILVPEGQADATRVAIAGSDAMARGEIGFELFNKSDMGLTNFAQKINYQRALQGELVRTIMQEDGVESARVHLALPERTLFRADRSEPKAAVTIAMKPGQTADAARVAGIQRLVAAAVPDLPESQVVVLDSAGRVISALASAETETARTPDMEEKAAVEGYYRARARGAIERAMPGLKFTLRVLALPIGESSAPSDPAAAASADWVPSGEGASRNFRLRMMFVSEAAIDSDDQQVVHNAVFQATALSPAQGDSLSFEVGPVDPLPESTQPVAAAPPRVNAALPETVPAPVQLQWPSLWVWLAGALAIALLIVWGMRRSGATRLDPADHEAFAARLRRQLNLEDGDVVA